MLILRQFQKLKAPSVCSLITNPSSWEEFRSILKTYRAIFLISRLLFEKMNFLHQQNAAACQMAAKCKIFLQKASPQNVKIRFSQNHLRCSPMVWNGFGDAPRVSKNVFHHLRAFAETSKKKILARSSSANFPWLLQERNYWSKRLIWLQRAFWRCPNLMKSSRQN